jgi:hypothetical protein
MLFKGQAQRRKFAQLLVEGKISNETFEEWNRETGGRRLPERPPQTGGGTEAKGPEAASSDFEAARLTQESVF